MTKEGIYEFITRQKTPIISSVGEDGHPATRALIQPVLIVENVIWFATRPPRIGPGSPSLPGSTARDCILKFTGFEAQWLASQRTQTIKL